MPRFEEQTEQFERRVPVGRWQVVTVEFTAARTDTVVPHQLPTPDPDQIDYEVLRVNGPGFVYHDGSVGRRPWGQGFIVLRATTAPLVADIRVSVSSEPIRSRTIPQAATVGSLDAQTLNGQSGSYYQDAGNINAGTLAAARGGTGENSYTKGDLLVAKSAGDIDKLAVGADGEVLTADSGETLGVKWATVAALGGAPNSASYLTLGTDGTLTSERVLTAGNGIDFVDGGAGSTLTVNGQVLFQQTTLTDSQISGLGTTPITVVTAPGAGKVAIPIAVSLSSDCSAGAYNNPNVQIRFAGDSTDLFTATSGVLNTTTKKTQSLRALDVAIDTSVVTNVAIQISTSAAVTGGNAANTYRVRIYYTLMSVL